MASRRTASPHEPRRITRTMPATQLVALLLAFVLAAGTGGILAAGLVIPVALGANAATDSTIELFEEVPDELQPGPLSQASFVYAADGTQLATFYAQNRIVVPLDQVSDAMKHAVIAIEDERFYEHGGIDPRGITRAFANNLAGQSTQGASTLTQQYVKNVLIDQAEQEGDPFGILEAREDSVERKLREAKLAIALEKEMSKDEILQGYLNVAQFGITTYGVETASRYYFNKSAADLTPVEAATIAGVTKAPSLFDPTANPEQAEARRNIVLNKMYGLGYITADEYNEARTTPLADTLHITPVPVGCQAAGGSAFFCDYVIKEIMGSPEFGETTAERRALLYRGGLQITTTLDLGKQIAAEEEITGRVPAENSADLEAAIVSVEPGTGKILAMAQNEPYDPTSNPAPGTTSVNYSADFARGGSRGFQPGSTFKPFVLAEWLKAGHTLNETVNATKVTRTNRDFTNSCGGVNIAPWSPANTEGSIGGRMPVLRATYLSINTAYVDMASKLDLCNIGRTAWDMGFRPTQTNTGRPVHDATFEDMYITPSMVIGTLETSPLQLAAASATLASNGTYCEPVAITKVVKPDGEELPVPSANCNPNALPPNVAATVTHAMESVITEGTARGRGLDGGRPAAGKTGTNQLSAQTWFMGFTPQLATTVWVGEASGNTSHLNIWFEGRHYRPLYGSHVAAPTWQAYMNRALAGAPVIPFPGPDPALVGAAPRPTNTAPPASGGDGGQPQPQGPEQPAAPEQPAPPAQQDLQEQIQEFFNDGGEGAGN
ncbi:penicillin-binding protein [Xylanimonas oleitrophica]|uniref:Penicillin-binding protein n=1 Tax=Xylanimonas oleitrophica TaxID=2607479 RepID=A0A2W5YC49_9MICO|nr:transglycosylase domain-containing protein [Xylanimonas oleitrophica]PZR51661.1 penicillin-binding protein [Xylanimonas oleitrophica]